MANEKRLIDANALKTKVFNLTLYVQGLRFGKTVINNILESYRRGVFEEIDNAPTVDAVEVVRCQNCVHAEPLDRNCEINTCHYMHCKLWRGEETKNVWHKYKKYYKDYSLVERDGYCDAGAKMDGGNEDG